MAGKNPTVYSKKNSKYPGKAIIFFDGVCNLCNGFIQVVVKHEKKPRFFFAPLQGKAAMRILGSTEGATKGNLQTIYLYDNGKLHSKSTAALKILMGLGGAWKLFAICLVFPRPLRDFFYSLVASNRYRLFGKRNTCMIPTPELKKRFLM